MKNKLLSLISRKTFIQLSSLLTITTFLQKFNLLNLFAVEKELAPRPKRSTRTNFDLTAVKGNNIETITRKSIDLLGGISRFVQKKDIVVIKPNIGWNRAPQYAANTNPIVVATVVKMCYEAGAKLVKVFDNSCNNIKMSYKNSGIQQAARKAGAQVQYISDWKFIPGQFPKNSPMGKWPIYRDAVKCDCFINIPVAKHHYLAGVTLSMKNLMGVCAENRGSIHWKLARNLADLTAFIHPDLTIIDGYRVLMRNGPAGGSLNDVSIQKTIIASTDPVLADAYALLKLFRKSPKTADFLKEGVKQKLGTINISKAKIKTLTI